jgi:hypothetical protein
LIGSCNISLEYLVHFQKFLGVKKNKGIQKEKYQAGYKNRKEEKSPGSKGKEDPSTGIPGNLQVSEHSHNMGSQNYGEYH